MAMGIYAGAGGVKTVSSIYVGAGGVKTVSAVYVGAGSVKQVWPAYAVGDALLSFPSSSYWTGYRRLYTSSDGGIQSSYSESISSYTSYVSISIGNRILNTVGAFICSKETIYATGLQYVGIEAVVQDTSSLTTQYNVYCSVGSSQSSIISSDSGVGSYSYVTATNPTYVRNHFLINLTNCTRTGYFKFGYVVSGNTNNYDNNGTFYVYKVIVGNSTAFSDYAFNSGYGSSWFTISVT